MNTLPVPELHKSMERYLRWVHPLLSKEEFEITKKIVAEFIINDGEKGQELLERFAAEKSKSSWLIDYWVNSYLSGRGSLPLETSISLELTFDHSEYSSKAFLARLIVSHAKVSVDYIKGLFPDTSKVSGYQFSVLKGSARVANPKVDKYYFNEKKGGRHICLIKDNICALLPVIDEELNIMDEESISDAIEEFMNKTSEIDGIPFSAISYLPAEDALTLFTQLLVDQDNKYAYEAMNDALFTLTFINERFTETEALHNATYSPITWAYKPYGYIYNKTDKTLYCHSEHTWQDGATTLDIMVKANEYFIGKDIKKGNRTSIKKLDWNFTGDTYEKLKDLMGEYLKKILEQKKVVVKSLKPQTERKFSKDAFMQFALQYAQYKTFGKIKNTYEAVDMRQFQCGRTECVRPVSDESVAFVMALDSKPSLELYEKAEKEHRQRIIDCKNGEGVNRHLTGLQFILEKNGVHSAIFNDKGYKEITHDHLSTTTVGGKSVIRYIDFTPAYPDAIGVYYLFDNKEVHFLLAYTEAYVSIIETFCSELKKGVEKISALLG